MVRLPYRGDSLQASRDRISAYWKRAGYKYARRLGRFALFGPGAIAAAGAANFFVKAPKLDNMFPRRMGGGRKRARVAPAPSMASSGRNRGSVIDQTSYTQYKKLRKEYTGRRLTLRNKMSKILNSHVQETVDRYSAANDPTSAIDDGGSTNVVAGFNLLAATTSTDPEQNPNLPVFVYDLTSIRNNYVGSAAPTDAWEPAVASRLERTAAGSYGMNSVGATGVTRLWQTERAPVQSYKVADRAFIEWFDIRMVLYGARSKPSEVFVELWQFDDPRKGFPLSASNDGGVTFTTESISGRDGNAFNQFWNAKLDTMVGTGIAYRGIRTDTDGCKVLYSKKFVFNPISSTEKDSTGHMVKFNLKYDMNKMCRYDWYNPFDTTITAANLDNPNSFVSESTGKQVPYTHPKGRVFLVVRANVLRMAPSADLDLTVEAADMFPSFDLLLRRKRSDVKI